MENTLFLIAITSAVVAVAISGITLWLQQHRTDQLQSQREAWERAQEVRQQGWHTQQERHHSDLEKYFATKFQDAEAEWQRWEQKAAAQTLAFHQQLTVLVNKIQLEHELARIPRIEDVPVSHSTGVLADQSQSLHFPLHLAGADLSGRDLSSRFLSHADLRGVKLVNARLYMVDLSWACLAGADLSGADLSAANLTHTDLRGANLSGANLLVADMQNALVIGANLLNTRSLTLEQVHTTIYDGTTNFDEHVGLATSSMLQLEHSHSRSLQTSLTAAAMPEDMLGEPAEFVLTSMVQEAQASPFIPASELPRTDVPAVEPPLAESIAILPSPSLANMLETPLPEEEVTITVTPLPDVSETALSEEEVTITVTPLPDVSETALPEEEVTTTTASQDELEAVPDESSAKTDVNP